MMHRRDGKAYLDCLAFVAFEDTHDRFCPLRTLSIFQALVQPGQPRSAGVVPFVII